MRILKRVTKSHCLLLPHGKKLNPGKKFWMLPFFFSLRVSISHSDYETWYLKLHSTRGLAINEKVKNQLHEKKLWLVLSLPKTSSQWRYPHINCNTLLAFSISLESKTTRNKGNPPFEGKTSNEIESQFVCINVQYVPSGSKYQMNAQINNGTRVVVNGDYNKT